MHLTLTAGPLIALIAGILILIVPRLLNYIVALYLIIVGLLGLFGAHNYALRADAASTPYAVSSANTPHMTIDVRVTDA
jgi:hypothetical protein